MIGLSADNGMAVQLLVHFNATHSMHFEKAPSSYEVKKHLSIKEGIPADFITLTMDGRILGDGMTIESTGLTVVVIRAVMAKGLMGGKGGFGAMLRALAKQAGTKKTTDFGACRDLSGRRLRHVNDEKILQKWKEAKDRGEDFDVEEETPTGIEMWYLGTPSWADGIKTDYKKKFLKDRRKSKMCMDWVRARKDRKSPEGAPVWWGCPRGRRCEFAHGEGEIRGAAAEAMGREKTNEKDLAANRKRDAYVGAHSQQEEDNACSNMVLQGMRAQKRARLSKAEIDVQNDNLNVMSMTMMGDADFPNYDDFQAAAPAPIQKIVKPSKSQEKTPSAAETTSVKSSSAAAPATVSGDIASSGCKWLKTLSGRLILSNEGEVEAESEFATASVSCTITSGKWYYEVELLSAGLLQVRLYKLICKLQVVVVFLSIVSLASFRSTHETLTVCRIFFNRLAGQTSSFAAVPTYWMRTVWEMTSTPGRMMGRGARSGMALTWTTDWRLSVMVLLVQRAVMQRYWAIVILNRKLWTRSQQHLQY